MCQNPSKIFLFSLSVTAAIILTLSLFGGGVSAKSLLCLAQLSLCLIELELSCVELKIMTEYVCRNVSVNWYEI